MRGRQRVAAFAVHQVGRLFTDRRSTHNRTGRRASVGFATRSPDAKATKRASRLIASEGAQSTPAPRQSRAYRRVQRDSGDGTFRPAGHVVQIRSISSLRDRRWGTNHWSSRSRSAFPR